MKIKLNFEELPQATAFLLEKVEELTISINEMKQLLKRQTAAKEEMIGINEACEILSLAKSQRFMLLFRQIKSPIINLGKCLNSNVPNLWSGWKKAGKNRLTKRAYTKRYKKE